MNKQLTDILNLKNSKPQITQREIAQQMAFSLGKVNQILEKLKEQGLLDDQLRVSPQGVQYIASHHPQRAVILAAGYGMRMVPINTEEPKGLLEVHHETLIERLIHQLRAKGIDDIYIVVGFMKEHYEYLIDKYHVKLIVNPHYDIWNNTYSLYLAKQYLADSYIVPCDLWFHDNPFATVEGDSWYLFTSKRIPQSTWQVNSRGRVSHVKQDGNRMVGLSYLNEQDGKKVAQQLDRLYRSKVGLDKFWEAVLTDNSQFLISGLVIANDQYAEINSYEELRDLDENSNLLKNDAIDVIKETLRVPASQIHHIRVLKKGMTNRSFIFKSGDHHYIMRIPGAGTAKLINRQHEYDVYQQIKQLPYVEKVLYLNPQNGYKLTQFIENSHNCNASNWRDVSRCMHLLKQMHDSHFKVGHTFDLYQQIKLYERLRGSSSAYRDYEQVKANVLALKKFVDRQPKEWTLCHIDANPDNFIFDQKGDVYLIDWEYAGMQDAHLDIAMFAIYSMYDQHQLDHLIDLYFGQAIPEAVRYKIYAYVAISGLLWSNWCEYKQSLGLDFGEYSLAQYRYAKEYSRKVLDYLKEEKENANN